MLGSDAVSRSFRVGDVNFIRELFTIEVYATVSPEDPERDAVVEPPWSTLPWHLIALMEEAVGRGWGAFSQAEATRRGVEWLDLVRSKQMNARLASLVETFEREGFRPLALQPLVSAEEARRRWAALAAFYKAHGHFLVTNGPYQVKRWSAEAVTLDAFRDLTYPLGVGSYDAYAVPRRGYITNVEQEKGGIRLSGDIETIVKFARSYRIERAPIQSISRDVLKRAAPECRYVVIDDKGERRARRRRRIGRWSDVSNRSERKTPHRRLHDHGPDRWSTEMRRTPLFDASLCKSPQVDRATEATRWPQHGI